MNIVSIIVHKINKEQNDKNTSLKLSEKPLPIDDVTIDFITRLNARFLELSSTFAYFESESLAFPQKYNEYYTNQNRESFISFTKSVTAILMGNIQNMNLAKGGYLVFVDYTVKHHYLGIFMIRDIKGMNFEDKGTGFEIQTGVVHIDFDKFAMACRINLDSYKTKEERYLNFIKQSNEVMSEYFLNWISRSNEHNSQTDTERLFQVISALPYPSKIDDSQMTQDETFVYAVDFIKSQKRKVDIYDLSYYLYGDRSVIVNHANELELDISREFKADSTKINKFIRVEISAEDIILKFPKALLRKNIIRVNRDNIGQIIIESLSLATKLASAKNEND